MPSKTPALDHVNPIYPERVNAFGTIIWSLAAAFFLYQFFLRTFVGTIGEQVITDLHLNAIRFSSVGVAYFVTYGCMQIPAGMLAQRFGTRRMLTLACCICALGTLMFSQAHSFWMAAGSRLLMGFGAAFAFVCLVLITVTWFPKRYMAFFIGLSQLIGTLGPVIAGGPLVSYILATQQGWRMPLANIALVGLGLGVLLYVFGRDKQGATTGYTPTKLTKQSIISLCRSSQVWLIASYSGACYASLAILGIVWGTLFLQSHGLSQAHAASIISIAWVGHAIGCPLLGFIADISKQRKLSLILCAITGVLASTLLTYLHFENALIYTLLFFVIGMTAAGQNIGFAAICDSVKPEVRGVAIGLNNAMITVFDIVFTSLVSYLIYLHAGHQSTHFSDVSFSFGLSVLPLLYCVALLCAAFIKSEQTIST